MKKKKDDYLKFKDYIMIFSFLFSPLIIVIPLILNELFGFWGGLIGIFIMIIEGELLDWYIDFV